jgi:hypothetical protein
MSFQVVELELDERGNEVARKVVPYPYQSREEALATVKSLAAAYSEASFDQDNNYWHAIGSSGERLRIAVEEIAPAG